MSGESRNLSPYVQHLTLRVGEKLARAYLRIPCPQCNYWFLHCFYSGAYANCYDRVGCERCGWGLG